MAQQRACLTDLPSVLIIYMAQFCKSDYSITPAKDSQIQSYHHPNSARLGLSSSSAQILASQISSLFNYSGQLSSYLWYHDSHLVLFGHLLLRCPFLETIVPIALGLLNISTFCCSFSSDLKAWTEEFQRALRCSHIFEFGCQFLMQWPFFLSGSPIAWCGALFQWLAFVGRFGKFVLVLHICSRILWRIFSRN